MTHLLPHIPPPTQDEINNPRPLIAKLDYSTEPTGSLALNVLGGSKSRDAIALDPDVSSGRLPKGKTIKFGQVFKSYLPAFEATGRSVSVQMEILSSSMRRWVPTTLAENKGGMALGMFSAGTEGGFLLGGKGVVPWLCRTPGTQVDIRVAPAKGERRALGSVRWEQQVKEIRAHDDKSWTLKPRYRLVPQTYQETNASITKADAPVGAPEVMHEPLPTEPPESSWDEPATESRKDIYVVPEDLFFANDR